MEATLHDAICNAGATTIGLYLGCMGLAFALPWLWKKTRFTRMRLMSWVRYKRRVHRYKVAMKVFDEPVRWREM